MVDLESSLRDVLLREEPEVPPAHATLDALAVLERAGDLALDELRRYAFADPAIAVALLEAANLTGAEAVASLPDAEARLGEAGFVRVVRAALDRERCASSGGPLAAARRRGWRAAVVSAMLCRELARDRGVPSDEAYVCGLLHDVGRLAAFAAFERLVAGTRPRGSTPLRRWEALADRWHVALGLAVAERHSLPRSVVEVIAFHHPGPARLEDEPRSPLLRIVRTVDELVSVLMQGADSGAAVDGADLTSGEAAHLSEAVARMLDHVATLERRPPPRERGPGEAPLPLRESLREGVRLRLAGREYVAVGFAPHQLLVTGPAPLGEGALLEVEVLDRRRAPFHARVLTAWQEGARFGAIVLPLALSGPSLAAIGGTLPAGADA
jgi:putative nucleotidyltransferase with HDIG domain